MARFFITKEQVNGDKAYIEGSDVRHIYKVLRMKPGDIITLADDEGFDYQARIVDITQEVVECDIVTRQMINREPPLEVVLCQGLPKGDKLELIIQKGVELGVNRVVPMECARSVVQLKKDKAVKRHERWQRVAMEAAKQSRRNKIPEVSPLVKMTDALKLIPENSLTLIPWEEEEGNGLKQALESYNKKGQVWIFIGPEGGFTEEEIEMAQKEGAVSVTLGPRILRTETAGIAALTMALYQLGDLGG